MDSPRTQESKSLWKELNENDENENVTPSQTFQEDSLYKGHKGRLVTEGDGGLGSASANYHSNAPGGSR